MDIYQIAPMVHQDDAAGADKHQIHKGAGAVEEVEREMQAARTKYKMSAVKQLLCGDMKKHIDFKEKELKTQANMRSALMIWAITQRSEKRGNGVKDMSAELYMDEEEPRRKEENQLVMQHGTKDMREGG